MTTCKNLEGLTFTSVAKNRGNDELIFTCEDGRVFKFYHEQDCCESVSIDDIVGDLSDLEGTPIMLAEERISQESDRDSITWTFYTFRTIKGTVTVKWYGSSNGCYSEAVDFTE